MIYLYGRKIKRNLEGIWEQTEKKYALKLYAINEEIFH
jgi:hypothetical protein